MFKSSILTNCHVLKLYFNNVHAYPKSNESIANVYFVQMCIFVKCTCIYKMFMSYFILNLCYSNVLFINVYRLI